jgi:hypothetical protein
MELHNQSPKCLSYFVTGPKDTEWRYDDEFYLTIGDKVIVSSQRTTMEEKLSTQNDMYVFDFAKLYDTIYTGSDSEPYCYGVSPESGSCSFPKTQTRGEVKIDILTSAIYRLSAEVLVQGSVDLQLHMIGDNDPKVDCQHSGIELTWDVEYVETQISREHDQ